MAARKQYNFFYKIYRRLRYLRYIRKLRRSRLNAVRKAEKDEKKEARIKAREQRIAERTQEREKRRLFKQESNKIPELASTTEKVNPEIIKLKIKNLEKLEQEKEYEKIRRKRLLSLYLKILRRKAINTLRSLNRRNFSAYIRGFRQSRSQRLEMMIIAVNSLAVFILSFFLIFIVSQLTSAISATFFDFSTIMHYDNNYYMVQRDEWYADPVKLIFSTGPVAALLTGLISLIIFSKIRNDAIFFKLFFFWNYVHGFGFFFGGLLIGSLFSMGFGHAIIWSYIRDTGKLVYSMIALVAMVSTGLLSTRSLLITANSYFKKLDKENRRRFVNGQIFYPFLAGNLVLFMFWLPKSSQYFQMVELSTFFILLPILATYRAYKELYFEDEEKQIKLMPRMILLAVLTIVILRLVLGIGIPIGTG